MRDSPSPRRALAKLYVPRACFSRRCSIDNPPEAPSHSGNRRLIVIRTAWMFRCAVTGLAVLGTGRAMAQSVIVVAPPRVAYYYAPPVVSYYAPPAPVAVVPRTAYYYDPPV